jgi:exopolysaccharide biosynthesis protein
MVVSSQDGCTIKELVEFASNNGMYEGILLDGGSSTEYKFTDNTSEINFKSTNSLIKDFVGRKEPPVFIYGYFK